MFSCPDPTEIKNLDILAGATIVDINAGSRSIYMHLQDGRTAAMGYNSFGQLVCL